MCKLNYQGGMRGNSIDDLNNFNDWEGSGDNLIDDLNR